MWLQMDHTLSTATQYDGAAFPDADACAIRGRKNNMHDKLQFLTSHGQEDSNRDPYMFVNVTYTLSQMPRVISRGLRCSRLVTHMVIDTFHT